MTEGGLIDLCNRLDVEVQGTNGSGWVVAHCPFAPYFHPSGSDKNPSFFMSIRPEGGSGFNCFTCKETGRISQMVAKLSELRGENYLQLLTEVEWADLPTEFEGLTESDLIGTGELTPVDEKVLDLYPFVREEPEAIDYLKERGVTPKAARKLDLRYDPEEGRILFPVRDRAGDFFGLTGRTIIGGTPKVRDYFGLPKNQLLLNENNLRLRGKTVLVEGLFAVAHLVSIGADKHCNVVASMGSKLLPSQADRLVDHDLPVYILYDDDEAGDIGLWGKRFAEFGETDGGAVALIKDQIPTFVCYYPEHRSDVDEFTLGELRWSLENAEFQA